MHFEGIYNPRSSVQPNSNQTAPSETKIQGRNPQRKTQILSMTGWPALFPGSLNLRVDSAVLDELEQHPVKWEESGSEVIYPAGWEHIPILRQAYWYYSATASRGEKSEPVLVRRPKRLGPHVVELFAPISLIEAFNLAPGETVHVELCKSEPGA